ncbi:MAG TPA: flagellar export chaperone FliS [Kineosporiaceae bacterium]|nr:flagellar export chaperone FliS [Kineosporiaceae bacterium]
MSYTAARARYASDSTDTASPARLLTMMYDRLVSDLASAEAAMLRADIAVTGERIGRAQEILLELAASLDIESWPEGEPLRRLYLWMVNELWTARLRKQPEKVAECRQLIEPLRDAWRMAAIETSQREVAAVLSGGT